MDLINATAIQSPPERERDCWSTPRRVYDKICEYWGVYPQMDVAADFRNKQCELYFDHKLNALNFNWVDSARHQGVEPIFWMNPPYSQPLMTLFIKHAIKEAARGGVTLFLLPANVDQEWYHDLIIPFEHKPWRGRIKFEPPPGVTASTPRYGNIHGVIRR